MTPEEKFASLPEWLRIAYRQNNHVYNFVKRFLHSDHLPMECFFEKLAESLIDANEQLTRNFENYVANNRAIRIAVKQDS